MIFNFIAGDTLVTALESLAFKGRWIFTNLVGGVDQCAISTARSCSRSRDGRVWRLHASLTVRQGYLQRWLATKELTEPARTFSLEEVGAAHEWMGSGRSVGKIVVII